MAYDRVLAAIGTNLKAICNDVDLTRRQKADLLRAIATETKTAALHIEEEIDRVSRSSADLTASIAERIGSIENLTVDDEEDK